MPQVLKHITTPCLCPWADKAWNPVLAWRVGLNHFLLHSSIYTLYRKSHCPPDVKHEFGFLTPKTRPLMFFLRHERLQIHTLLPHLRLLTHVNIITLTPKPAFIQSCTRTVSFAQTGTYTHNFSTSNGVTWQPFLCTTGYTPMHHGKGYVQYTKGQILCFKMLLAQLRHNSTTISLVSRFPAELHWFGLAIQESNYCKHNTENISFSTLPDVLIKRWMEESMCAR